MSATTDDEGRDQRHRDRCAQCGTALAAGQRYCLDCGARCGPLPGAIAERIAPLLRPPEGGGQDEAPAEEGSEEPSVLERLMPTPQAAGAAVMALLAFGVIIGSVTGQIAQSAGIIPVVVEESAAIQPSASGESREAATPLAELPAPPTSEAATAAAPAPLAEVPESPVAAPHTTLPPELPPEEVLPPVSHVFLIVLGDHGYEEAFGPASAAPYLASTLAGKGELLSNFYAVARGGLANRIALVSGQGPTAETAAGCPEYRDIAPASVGAEGQVEGDGCAYPVEALTLGGQLAAGGATWRAYVEDADERPSAGAEGCRPEAAAADPFLYFHSFTDVAECGEDLADLGQLTTDLDSAKTTPALSYIVPDACHAGEERGAAAEPVCGPAAPAGLAAAGQFLESVVPQVMKSPAYEEGGLIAITFAEAPQEGPNADSSSCCATPEYPNLPQPEDAAAPPGPVQPSGGGGRVGLLLISPFVDAGSTDETGYYNHFSLLRSVEELFGLTPLGYAAAPAVTPFDSSVYTAIPGGAG